MQLLVLIVLIVSFSGMSVYWHCHCNKIQNIRELNLKIAQNLQEMWSNTQNVLLSVRCFNAEETKKSEKQKNTQRKE